MTRIGRVAALVLGSLSLPLPAPAGDRAALASLARSGTEIYVTYVDGIERRGRIAMLDEDGLQVVFGGRMTMVPWDQVVTVDRRGDAAWDGAAKGAGIAAGFYGVVAILGGARTEEVAPFVLSGALAWGAVGAIVDALNVGRTRVYVSPAFAADSGPATPRRPLERASRSAPRGIVVGVSLGF